MDKVPATGCRGPLGTGLLGQLLLAGAAAAVTGGVRVWRRQNSDL